MSRAIIWLGVSVEDVENPTSPILCFGSISNNKLATYHEVGLVPKNVEYMENQIMSIIEALRNLKAEMKIAGVEE